MLALVLGGQIVIAAIDPAEEIRQTNLELRGAPSPVAPTTE